MIERLTHEEQCIRFGWACEWIQSLGVRLHASRVEQYLRDLDGLAKAVSAGKGLEFERKIGQSRLINTVLEATECIDIHAGLRNHHDPALPQLVNDFVSGTALRSEEQPKGSHPRNSGFHLWFAASAARVGNHIDLAPPGDVSLLRSSHTIAVECKRVFSQRKIEHNLRVGFRQLAERYEYADVDRKMYGLLAVSASKLYETVFDARDENQMKLHYESRLTEFAAKYQYCWSDPIDSRSIALFLHWTGPVRVADPYLLVIATQFDILPLCQPDSDSGLIVRGLKDQFHKLSTM